MKQLKPHPPTAAQKLLLLFLRSDLAEDVTGDLDERFNRVLKNRSHFRAKIDYWFQVINYIRPFALRKGRLQTFMHYAMIQNYFKIGWRNLMRQKMYSAIKIGGLAVGLAACLLIALFLKHELSYDRSYKNGDRVYRILRESEMKGNRSTGLHFPSPFIRAVRDEFPEIENAGHYCDSDYFGAGENEVRRADQAESIHEEGFAFMDQELIEILELPFIRGSSSNALTEPNTIVITESKAHKVFPGEDPVGKLLVLNNDNQRTYRITGVIRDFPATSHLQFNFLMTTVGKEFWPGESVNWESGNYMDYVLVRKDTDIRALEDKLRVIVKNHMLPSAVAQGSGKQVTEWLQSMSFHLQPVQDIYMNEAGVGDGLQHGDRKHNWLFGAIAVFILVIACINFINLSTARSTGRAKEVGLRKVSGSSRGSIIRQFLIESVLFSLLAVIIGLILVWISISYFSQLLGRTFSVNLGDWWLLPVVFIMAILVGILAGIYPSFYLSSFQPAKVLKGNTSLGLKGASARGFLVSFQFVISVILIISTIVIYRQMNFIMDKKLGYNREQVMVIESAHTLGNAIQALKNELIKLPPVQHVSISSFLPVEGSMRDNGPTWKEGMNEDNGVESQHWRVDHDYVKTLGLEIVEGRDFNPAMASDSQAVMINQTMARALQLDRPVGQIVSSLRGDHTIIGVVKDFHSDNLRQVIRPMEFILDLSPNSMLVKLNTTDTKAAIESVTAVWKKFSPNQSIRFSFLDQSYKNMYDDVLRMGKLFTAFSCLAIMVACLGLFALSAFMIEQRSKEISIRLVLGASLGAIVHLLTINFTKLVTISILIAAPVAWYLMNEWLKDFSYKTEITIDIFILAGIVSLLIALLTISYQSVRAAVVNPADRLRSE